MNPRTLIFLGAGVGSVLGGIIPSLWGASPFSFSSMLFGALGTLLGVWLGYRAAQQL